MVTKTVLRALAVASLAASSATAALTKFPTEYDYMTTHVRRNLAAASNVVLSDKPELSAPFTTLLDATERDIAASNLTYTRHYERINAFYADANDTTLPAAVYDEMAKLFYDTPRNFEYAPLAWCDVVFDALESVAEFKTLWQIVAVARRTTEQLVEARVSTDVMIFHVEEFYRGFQRMAPEVFDRLKDKHNAIAAKAFETFGFDADVEQSGRWDAPSDNANPGDEV